MSSLSSGQFILVYNMFSLTIAAMGAAFIFFTVGRSQVGIKYRPALLISSLVVAIACYHPEGTPKTGQRGTHQNRPMVSGGR